MKSLFKTVVLITIFSFLTRLLGFVFRIILSRTIGAEGIGLYQVASSLFMVLLTIIASGLPLIISRMSAVNYAQKEEKKQASLITVAMIHALILSILLCVIVLAFKNVFAKFLTDEGCILILIVMLPSLIFSAVYSVFRGSLWGKGNYFALCVTEFYEQVVRIVVGILVISSSYSAMKNAINIGWSMTIACFLSMIYVVLLFFYYGGKMGKAKKEQLKPLIKQSTPITLMRVVGSMVQPLIAFIIPARLTSIGYTSSQALSLYGVAVGMTMPLLFIPSTIIGSLSTALVPDISAAVAQKNDKHIEERVSSSIFFALFISAMFVPVFIGMGEQIGLFLYDNIMSGTLLQSAAWVLIPLGFCNITSALLNSLGLEGRSFVNFIIGGIVMFISLWILPSLIGINALVWGMGLNYLVVSLLNFLLLKKHIHTDLKLFKKILKILLILLPSSALTAFVVSLAEYVMPLFFTLMIGGITGVTSFVLLAYAINLIDIKTFIVIAKNKINFPKVKINKKLKKNV